jgi:hypothetical protein
LKIYYEPVNPSTAIPVISCAGPYVHRLPHFVDSLFTDGGVVVSLTHQVTKTIVGLEGFRFTLYLSSPILNSVYESFSAPKAANLFQITM